MCIYAKILGVWLRTRIKTTLKRKKNGKMCKTLTKTTGKMCEIPIKRVGKMCESIKFFRLIIVVFYTFPIKNVIEIYTFPINSGVKKYTFPKVKNFFNKNGRTKNKKSLIRE